MDVACVALSGITNLIEVAANPADRCYYCKRALFTRLLEEAARDGFPVVLDGGNRLPPVGRCGGQQHR